jgi:hypothetical protein
VPMAVTANCNQYVLANVKILFSIMMEKICSNRSVGTLLGKEFRFAVMKSLTAEMPVGVGCLCLCT